MAGEVVEIVGLAEFRRDLKAAGLGTKDAAAAMKKAGAPVLAKAAGYAPRASGALAGSGKISAAGTKGRVIFKPVYAPGAEFGAHGRWVGFEKWGSVPRFGYRALAEESENVFNIVTAELHDVLTVLDWFHEG